MATRNSDWADKQDQQTIKLTVNANATQVQQSCRVARFRYTYDGSETSASSARLKLGSIGVKKHTVRVLDCRICYAGAAWAGTQTLELRRGTAVDHADAVTLGSFTLDGTGVEACAPASGASPAQGDDNDVYYLAVTAHATNKTPGTIIDVEVSYYFEGI